MQPFSRKPCPFWQQDLFKKINFSDYNHYQKISVRNMTTILLLISCLVLQYARQISYWECRVANYYKNEREKCDCEKLVTQIPGNSEPFPVPVGHNHFHLDESFYPAVTITEGVSSVKEISPWGMARHIFIIKITPGLVDRPPQIS